ncbi:uncharacterized protein IL334_002376 [Kwoniella shivajii]|uniref:Right handed beta helix domain-containing protein n=1 Tax=Kwoniella shivajii TaxID=564305 RepID=A0ABZ1CUQ0_9TREE|nr:hypothetical protein IL334_002376 [Kwoniella shivajii]
MHSLTDPSTSTSTSSDNPSRCPSPSRRRRRRVSRTAPAYLSLSSSSSVPFSVSRQTPRFSTAYLSRLSSSSLLILTCVLVILLPLVSAAPPCVRFADYDSINQMFIDGGPGAKVFLCPNKLYRLSGSIVFTAADQELATFGYPTGSERATLRVEGKQTATAIQGDCRRCARVGIKSLIIDGNRKKLGRMKNTDDSTGLIVLGGNEGQSIKNCWIKNPRGFTGIHIREGDKLQCTGARIDKNEIGPIGEEYDPDPTKDGDDPELSPLGRPLADGISIACKDSFVRDNIFYDNTDASIVIYCSPGTLILANHITARTVSAMAGILLVDSLPFQGDYSGVIVKQNIIDAASRSIRVGIGIGATVWSDDTETILKGGTVINNGIKGKYMGFGIAAAGLENWKIKGNWDEAVHQGKKSQRCFDDPINPDPMPYLYNLETIKDCEIQDGFQDHDFQYVVCIDGLYDSSNPPKHDLPPLPHDLGGLGSGNDLEPVPPGQNPPQQPTTNEAEESDSESDADIEGGASTPDTETSPVGFSTGSEVMDDILEHSQQRMLEAIDHLHRRVDILAVNVKVDDKKKRKDKGTVGETIDPAISTHLEKLQRRVEHLETSQKTLVESAVAMRSSIQSWDQEMATIGEWQYDILLDVRHKLELQLQHQHPDSDSDSDSDFDGRNTKYNEDDDDQDDLESDYDMIERINSPRAGPGSGSGSGSGARRIDINDHSHPSIQRDEIRDLSNKKRLKDVSSSNGGEKNSASRNWWFKLILIQVSVMISIWISRNWWLKRKRHSKIL